MAQALHGGSDRRAFRERIAQGLVLGDAAYGSALTRVAGDRLVEALNLEQPSAVEALHVSYLRAGAEVLQTNTYAANRLQLAPFGLQDEVYRLNVQGAKIARAAREVAGRGALVAGSIGPLGVTRGGAQAVAEAAGDSFREQIEALVAGGVDLLLIETQADPAEAALALRIAREASDLPVILNFSFAEGDLTLSGHSVADIAAMLRASADPPDLFGVNCSLGPSHALRLLRQLRAAGIEGPFSVSPNAGPPMRVGAEIDYLGTPERFASLLSDLQAEGACLVGGCCGTDAAYIAALRDAREMLSAPARTERRQVLRPERAEPAPTKVNLGLAPRGGLREKLGREFVIGIELDPPRGSVVGKFLEDAEIAREAGADFVNVGDSPMARVRMGALAGAHLLQHAAGVEAVLHMTTRDRNRRALEADLLSAHALGVRSILALTGDRPREGGVYELDSIGLLEEIQSLNAGGDPDGAAIGHATEFLPGCAFDPGAEDRAGELSRLRRKLAAGARFVMTQPIYESGPLRRALKELGPPGVPLLLGVMPVYSHRHAVYLDREVQGIRVPAWLQERMADAGERGLAVGLEIAWQLVEELSELISGVYVVPSFGKVRPVAEFARRLRAAHPAAASVSSC